MDEHEKLIDNVKKLSSEQLHRIFTDACYKALNYQRIHDDAEQYSYKVFDLEKEVERLKRDNEGLREDKEKLKSLLKIAVFDLTGHCDYCIYYYDCTKKDEDCKEWAWRNKNEAKELGVEV